MTNTDFTLSQLVSWIFDCGAVAIRDVDAGEKPFLYSSGHHGPGYVMIKGLVSQRTLLEALLNHLALKVFEQFPEIEYVSGNATGGMIPAWELARSLSCLTKREIPYLYVRNTRKLGGHGEWITGDKQNKFFASRRRGIVMEELVNFATTTTNSAIVQRQAGHDVFHAATILFYDHEKTNELLRRHGVKLIYLLTIRDIMQAAIGRGYPRHVVESWESFLADPITWQTSRGIPLPQKEGE